MECRWNFFYHFIAPLLLVDDSYPIWVRFGPFNSIAFTNSVYPVKGCSIYEAEVTSDFNCAIEDVKTDGEVVESSRCIDVICDEGFQMNDKHVPEFFKRYLSV